MNYKIMSKEELMELGFSAISDDFDKSENSFIHQAISAAAIMAHELGLAIDYTHKLQYLDNLEDEELDSYVFDRTGLKRREALPSRGYITFYGLKGTVIPLDTKVSNGYHVFKTLYSDTIDKESVQIEVIALDAGNNGTYPSETITTLVDNISGVNKVSNQLAITAGVDKESDNDFKARYLDHIREPATTNNPSQFRGWAREIKGVGQARVIRGFKGEGTVQLIILDRNYLPAEQRILDEVKTYIEKVHGFDIKELSVIAPSSIRLNLNLNARYVDDLAKEVIKERIKENIRNYLKKYPDPNYIMRQVSYWDIAVIVKNTEGIIDINQLTINGSQDNISLSETEVAEMGEINDI